VLAHSSRLDAGDRAHERALAAEARVIVRRRGSCRASRSRDRRLARVEDAASLRRVGAIREIAGARRRQRRAVAQHEPGRPHVVSAALRRAASRDGLPDDGRPVDATAAAATRAARGRIAVPQQLGEAQRGERGPPLHDVEIVA
jgi:hypothetical protein